MDDPSTPGSGPQPASGTPSAPFTPESSPGCAKPLLVMGGAFVLLFLVAMVVVSVKGPSLFGLLFRNLAPALEEQLAEEVTEEERERLTAAFEAAADRAEEAGFDPDSIQALQKVQLRLGEVARQPTISREDVADLTLVLERFAGIASEPEAIPLPATELPPADAEASSDSGPEAESPPEREPSEASEASELDSDEPPQAR